MDIPVLIEPVAGNGYRASSGPPLGLNAEGSTRDEALANLRLLLDQRLAGGAQVTVLSVPEAANPWVEFAGMFKDDPYFDEWQQAIADNRRKADQEPDLP
jgi:predicted RNase H-like HicB family nuclease